MNDNKQPATQPQAEYSLPGVMKYLQSEWQRNERDRIQWELERAEMRAKIAKLEGEKHGLQLTVENYAKQLRLLESTVLNGSSTTSNNNTSNSKNAIDVYSHVRKQFDSLLEQKTDANDAFSADADADLGPLIDARKYLDKCIKDISYLLQSTNVLDPGEAGMGENASREREESDVAPNIESNSNSNGLSNGLTEISSSMAQTQTDASVDSPEDYVTDSSRRISRVKLSTLIKSSEQVTAAVACSQSTLALGLQTGVIKYHWHDHDTLHDDRPHYLTLGGHSAPITALAWHQQSGILISGDKSGLICIHNLSANNMDDDAQSAAASLTPIKPQKTYQEGVSNSVNSGIVQLEVSHVNEVFACVTSDGTVSLHKLENIDQVVLRRPKMMDLANSEVRVSFLDNTVFVAYTMDNYVECIDLKFESVVRGFHVDVLVVGNKCHISCIKAAAFQQFGSVVYVGLSNGCIMMLNAKDGQVITQLTRHQGPVKFIDVGKYSELSPDEDDNQDEQKKSQTPDADIHDVVMSAGSDSKVLLWRPDLKLLPTPNLAFSAALPVRFVRWNAEADTASFIVVAGEYNVVCMDTTTDRIKYIQD